MPQASGTRGRPRGRPCRPAPCPAGLRRWVGAMVPKLWTPHSQGWAGGKRPAGRAGPPPSPSRRAWPVVTFGGRQAENPELCRLPRPAALTLHALALRTSLPNSFAAMGTQLQPGGLPFRLERLGPAGSVAWRIWRIAACAKLRGLWRIAVRLKLRVKLRCCLCKAAWFGALLLVQSFVPSSRRRCRTHH